MNTRHKKFVDLHKGLLVKIDNIFPQPINFSQYDLQMVSINVTWLAAYFVHMSFGLALYSLHTFLYSVHF